MRVLDVTMNGRPLGADHQWHTILGAAPDYEGFPLVCARCLMKHTDPQARRRCDALAQMSRSRSGD